MHGTLTLRGKIAQLFSVPTEVVAEADGSLQRNRIVSQTKQLRSCVVGLDLVKPPPCPPLLLPILGIAFRLSFAARRVALRLLLSSEATFFRAADTMMCIHAFEQELGSRNQMFRIEVRLDAKRSKLFNETLNLFQLGSDGLRWLVIVEFDSAAQ